MTLSPEVHLKTSDMTSLPLEKMLDYHPVIYCVIDRHKRFYHVSRMAAGILGYQPEELTGRSLFDFIVEADREKTKRVIQQLYQGQFIRSFENRYCHKDGSHVTLQWSSQWDPEEQLLYCISHKKIPGEQQKDLFQHFAQKVKQFNARLFQTYERITDGVCILDDTWRFTYVNDAAATMLGLGKTDILAHNIWELFPEAAGTTIEQEYRRCYEQQVQVQFETYYPHPLNKWFSVTAYPSGEGISIYFRDISERKVIEAEMHKLSLIVKHTDNLVLLCDTDGRIKWVNDAFEQKTGYTLEEVLGKRPGDFLAGPETDQQVIARLREQYRKGAHFHEALLYYTKQQEKLWVDVTGKIIYDEKGDVKELFSIQTDITESKQLEEQLYKEREMRDRQLTAAVIQVQEQERSEIGKELHDNVNQLLTTAKLYLEVSQDPVMKEEELVKKSIGILQEAISEIRKISKQLSAPTVEYATLTESVKEITDKVAVCRPFSLEVDCSGIGDLEVPQDQHLAVYRILQEHLTNILKHAAARHVRVTLCLDGDNLVLRVSDDGIGFDLNQKRSGIGIINMQSRVDALKGSFNLKSAPGNGCHLEVCLPLQS